MKFIISLTLVGSIFLSTCNNISAHEVQYNEANEIVKVIE